MTEEAEERGGFAYADIGTNLRTIKKFHFTVSSRWETEEDPGDYTFCLMAIVTSIDDTEYAIYFNFSQEEFRQHIAMLLENEEHLSEHMDNHETTEEGGEHE